MTALSLLEEHTSTRLLKTPAIFTSLLAFHCGWRGSQGFDSWRWFRSVSSLKWSDNSEDAFRIENRLRIPAFPECIFKVLKVFFGTVSLFI